MSGLRYLTCDVFTDRAFGGNPLAVVPHAGGLSEATMRLIARELNLSETAFVLPAENGGARRVRFFTPAMELPFAGHPTVGTALMLAELGELPLTGDVTRVILEENVGPIPVEIRARDGRPISARYTSARLPERGPEPPGRTAIAEMLGLAEEDVRNDAWRCEAWSCGVPFVFVPVRDVEALGRCRMNVGRWQPLLSDFWAPHVYVVAPPDGDRVRARMFAPAMGIVEDPATGAAATALPGYLASQLPAADSPLRLVVEQGVEMGRPSRIDVEVERAGGALRAVHVGGTCVLMADATLKLPR
jgi:trans-2,3-dihydro-3-hydroxyanthranilate isomerase